MWTPCLLRSQSGGLFLETVSAAQFGQQMVFEREWGAIYSKQIFYPWQVMERATTVWRFNKSAQTNSGRTRLKWERVTSAWLWNKPWSHQLVYSGKLWIFGCTRWTVKLYSLLYFHRAKVQGIQSSNTPEGSVCSANIMTRHVHVWNKKKSMCTCAFKTIERLYLEKVNVHFINLSLHYGFTGTFV